MRMLEPEAYAADPAEIGQFFDLVRPEGPLLLVAIDPARKAPIQAQSFVMPAQQMEAINWCVRMNRAHNVYWTVNHARLMNGKASKKDIERFTACWADCDPDIFKHGGYAIARRVLEDHLYPELQETCSLIVDSGNGLQGIWLLAQPAEIDVGLTAYETLNEFVGTTFDGPGTHNADRVLRVPGTVNYPGDTKLARGYPQQARLATLMFKSDRRYTLDQIKSIAETGRLKRRFRSYLEEHPKAAARYSGSTEGTIKDSSGSGMDMSMTRMLRTGGFSLAEIRRLLDGWPYGGGGREQGDRYWDRIWAKTEIELDSAPAEETQAVVELSDIDLSMWPDIAPPPRRWFIPGMIPAGVSTVLHGDGGTGKTRLGMQACIASILVRDFIGIAPELSGDALFFSAELSAVDCWRMLDEVCYGLGLPDEQKRKLVGRLHIVDLVADGSPQLYGDKGWTVLGRRVLSKIIDVRPTLLVVDSASSTFSVTGYGMAEVYGFMGGFCRLLTQWDGSLLMLLHEGKGGLREQNRTHAYMGSVAWHTAARSRLQLDQDKDDRSRVTLTMPKASYSAPKDPLDLSWTNGAFLPHQADPFLDGIRDNAHAKAVLRIVAALDRHGQRVSHSPKSNNNLPKMAKDFGLAGSLKDRDLWAGMTKAQDKGWLQIETYQVNRNKAERLALTTLGRMEIGTGAEE